MNAEIRLPNITAPDTAGQLQQLKSYLYQLVSQINWALVNISSTTATAESQPMSVADARQDAAAIFSEIKPLIMKSTDIMNAYLAELKRRMEGTYIEQDDFETFAQGNAEEHEKFSLGIENAEVELSKYGDHIRCGILYLNDDGTPVIGAEIGQYSVVEEEEIFIPFVRYADGKTTFFDQLGNEAASIQDGKLNVLGGIENLEWNQKNGVNMSIEYNDYFVSVRIDAVVVATQDDLTTIILPEGVTPTADIPILIPVLSVDGALDGTVALILLSTESGAVLTYNGAEGAAIKYSGMFPRSSFTITTITEEEVT